jgi:primosomal protein N' (replication factor Y)
MTEETGLTPPHLPPVFEPADGVWLAVVVPTPAHSGVSPVLSYRHSGSLPVGQLVRVPLGRREVLGVVWEEHPDPPEGLDPALARNVASVLDALPPLNESWRRLVGFAARYYQRSLGEVALNSLPAPLRDLDATQLQRRLKRKARALADTPQLSVPEPSAEQAAVLQALPEASAPVLLFGSTGSGKTEVYLRAAEDVLRANDSAQVLVLVPEINLTPQLQARLAERLGPWLGPGGLACLHSGMTPPQRLAGWLAAHSGRSRVVLGTRLAIFTSMPNLQLMVVDEEHDPSYKSQEGARYSARDLAVYRARLETERLQAAGSPQRCQVLLGSATPSLESWHAADQGRYLRLHMPSRIGGAHLPALKLVDMNLQPKGTVLSPPLMAAIEERVARGEQSLVLLNRRGYAPVLSCGACDWKSQCPHCSAYRVFHKIDRTLRCHHCGLTERVPRACPDCGNLDIAPVGRGTEQLEEQLAGLLVDVKRPDGQPVRVARMDADSTRAKGALEAQLAALHSGEVDVLVGTQMVAKGHDFRRITLVASVNADAALFASDYRGPERLFALLMQAAGRAGRDSAHASRSEMWVQTWHPAHALFGALRAHDYPGFAALELAERQAAGMPPFGAQALLRADARTQAAAQAFLNTAAAWAGDMPESVGVTLYPAVPLAIARVANVERAQLLVESDSRQTLQRFLAAWQPVLLQARQTPDAKGLIRYAVDVDPLSI